MNLQETVISSRYVYQGKIVKMRVDQVKLPSGRQSIREVVEHQGAAAVVAVVPQGVLLVRQYRHSVGKVLLEIPAGKLEEGESPEECACRELNEETGYYSRKLSLLGQLYTSPGFSSEKIHLFRAENLELKPLPAPEDEIIDIQIVTPEKVLMMIKNGEINDAKTVAGLLMVFPFK